MDAIKDNWRPSIRRCRITIGIYICVCICVCMYVYIYIYTHTYILVGPCAGRPLAQLQAHFVLL
jgi:hypothetical protein